MTTAWRIALRYLVSKKSHGAVNIISGISVAGVAVATAAIVITLSVFNGFTRIAMDRLSDFDPDLKISPVRGKAIARADSLAAVLSVLPMTAAAVPVVEERGLAIYDNVQMPVIFKGVPDGYGRVVPIDSIVVDGAFMSEAYGEPAALLSPGVAMRLGARPQMASRVGLYVPRRQGRINPANPSAAFRGAELVTTAVYQLDQAEYDSEYMVIPLSTARELLEYESEATAIEVALRPGANIKEARRELQQAVGADLRVLTRDMQEEQAFKMIQVEKWVTFLMLAFILVIASFNIISTLSLLVIEKRDNMSTLISIGATKGMIRNIFVCLGTLISISGGIAGLAFGAGLALAQQYGGFIKLSGDPSQLSIHEYPVQVLAADLGIVFALVLSVSLSITVVTTLFTIKSAIKFTNPT